MPEYLVHYLPFAGDDDTACGSTDGDGATTDPGSVTCKDCKGQLPRYL